MARAEARLGAVAGVGASYTIVGPAAPTVFNLNIHLTNVTGAAIKVRVFLADNSWTTGEPTGASLKARIAYDKSIAANELLQISGVIMLATEKLVVYSDTASSLDVIASGVQVS